jgi:putative heme-binding domain-containing protein
MLRPDHPSLTAQRLEKYLTSDDPALRLEAVRTLREGNLPGRFDVLARLADDPSAPEPLRAEAVVGLAPDAEKHGDLLRRLADNGPASVRLEASRATRGLAREPSETLPEALSDWLTRLDGPADPAAGERVFFHSKGPGCYRCHQVNGRGGRAGPELSTAAATLTRERLIDSVLNPSKEIAPQFVAWNVARKDGTVFTGVLLDESLTGDQTYVDAKGERVVVNVKDVDDRQPSPVSLMPNDLTRSMSLQDFRDLLAYLRSAPNP